MAIFGRLFKTITLILTTYLLVINIILWANSPRVSIELLNVNNNFSSFHDYTMSSYRGSSWFYWMISTFPGPSTTIALLNTYGNIVTNFSVTNIGLLDAIIAVFRILTTPILFSVTVAADIINNAIWFISFINTYST